MKIIFIIFILLITLIFSSTSNAKWTKVLELENGISFYIDFDNTKAIFNCGFYMHHPKENTIDGLKIKVRLLNKDDIRERNLPKNTTGLVITEIDKDSPINYLQVNNIIVEAQKKKINTIGDLDNIVKLALKSNDKSLLIAIYNNNNQRRYIGVKLN